MIPIYVLNTSLLMRNKGAAPILKTKGPWSAHLLSRKQTLLWSPKQDLFFGESCGGGTNISASGVC